MTPSLPDGTTDDPHRVMKPRMRCGVFVPVIHQSRRTSDLGPQMSEGRSRRPPEAQLEEAVGLADAIDLDVRATDISTVSTVRPGMLYGGGKVEELGQLVKEHELGVVIVDHPLTPVQQRNLERAWHVKVLDRTGIILEIFGARAQTKEGRLQVDLAALKYQRGRLVRSWTHLERQRGGGGFMGGPGETQIEADRRALQTQIERLERQLADVSARRALHRQQRKKREVPVIALVGYTNAGKSTLFNKLTASDILAKDLLFATLDPTLRKITLPKGTEAILSDTVGFISELPTDLVAAFRATLEEVKLADVIVHVRDASHPDSLAQKVDVLRVLSDIGVEVEMDETADGDGEKSEQVYLETLNKADLLSSEEKKTVLAQKVGGWGERAYLISAIDGDGMPELLLAIENALDRRLERRSLNVKAEFASKLHLLYQLGKVESRDEHDDGSVTVTVSSNRWRQIAREFEA